MKRAIADLFDEVASFIQTNDTDPAQGLDAYFTNIVWSIEKDEWNALPPSIKEELNKRFVSYIS